jgi:hypothetical protein
MPSKRYGIHEKSTWLALRCGPGGSLPKTWGAGPGDWRLCGNQGALCQFLGFQWDSNGILMNFNEILMKFNCILMKFNWIVRVVFGIHMGFSIGFSMGFQWPIGFHNWLVPLLQVRDEHKSATPQPRALAGTRPGGNLRWKTWDSRSRMLQDGTVSTIVWLVVWNMTFIFHMGCHPSHWRSHIFQDGWNMLKPPTSTYPSFLGVQLCPTSVFRSWYSGIFVGGWT